MKSMIYAAAVIAVLLAVAAVQGFALSARAKKIDTLAASIKDAKKELKTAALATAGCTIQTAAKR